MYQKCFSNYFNKDNVSCNEYMSNSIILNRNIRNILFPKIANIEKENINMTKTTNIGKKKYKNIGEMRLKIHEAEILILQTIEKNINYYINNN